MKNNIYTVFEFRSKKKIYQLKKLHSTFAFVIYDRNFSTAKSYYLQFSIEDMWLIPKKEIIDEDITLYGWLFLYFGYNNQYIT